MHAMCQHNPMRSLPFPYLGKEHATIIPCANKLEGDHWAQMGGFDHVLDEMDKLGFGESLHISAEHGDGMADIASVLLQAETKKKEDLRIAGCGDNDAAAAAAGAPEPITVAILGRQNVGKSTLLNSIVDQDRVITGSVAGLTRDAIAVDFMSDGRMFSIVDTAGIRKASKRRADADDIENDSVKDAMRSLKLAHVCVLVLEAEKLQLTRQELAIADLVIREGRALVVVANKSDTLKGSDSEYARGVKRQLDGETR